MPDARKWWLHTRVPRSGEKQDAFGLHDGCQPCLRPLLRRRKCRRGVDITFLCSNVARRTGPRGAISKETAVNLSCLTTLSTLSLSLSFSISFSPFFLTTTATYLQIRTCLRWPRLLCPDGRFVLTFRVKIKFVYYVTRYLILNLDEKRGLNWSIKKERKIKLISIIIARVFFRFTRFTRLYYKECDSFLFYFLMTNFSFNSVSIFSYVKMSRKSLFIV